MAASEHFVYQRTNTAEGYMSFEKTNRGFADYITVESTVPAAGAALPQISSAAQEYTSADRFGNTIVCSGTWKKIGETWGYLRYDAKAASTAAYVITGRAYVKLDSSLTIAAGTDAFMIVASGLVTNVSSGNEFIGKFLATKDTNPVGYPAGDYAVVMLSPEQL